MQARPSVFLDIKADNKMLQKLKTGMFSDSSSGVPSRKTSVRKRSKLHSRNNRLETVKSNAESDENDSMISQGSLTESDSDSDNSRSTIISDKETNFEDILTTQRL